MRGTCASPPAPRAQERCDVRIAEGDSRLSGALYLAGAEHCALLSEAYAAFAHTNPMHTSVFPSVRRMEREVVAMTAALLGGARALPPPAAAAPLCAARPKPMPLATCPRTWPILHKCAPQLLLMPAGLAPAGAPAAFRRASKALCCCMSPVARDGRGAAARRRQPPRARRRRRSGGRGAHGARNPGRRARRRRPRGRRGRVRRHDQRR